MVTEPAKGVVLFALSVNVPVPFLTKLVLAPPLMLLPLLPVAEKLVVPVPSMVSVLLPDPRSAP